MSWNAWNICYRIKPYQLTINQASFIIRLSKKTGVMRYLLGHHLPTENTPYDIITMGSYGRVSSYDKEGNVNWQVGSTYCTSQGFKLVIVHSPGPFISDLRPFFKIHLPVSWNFNPFNWHCIVEFWFSSNGLLILNLKKNPGPFTLESKY